MHGKIADKIYSNRGNPDVLAMVGTEAHAVLDVGCGDGSNAALLRERDPGKRVYGITGSRAEAALAATHLEQCWVTDLEGALPAELRAMRFDCIVLSHVLEHLRDPAELLNRLAQQLSPQGYCIIAVPNVLYWRERVAFLQGKFEYQASGTLDETHLRFFTYETAARYLLAKAPSLRLVERKVTGSVPLWVLRRHLLPRSATAKLDALGCALRPNLFGTQILMKAERVG